LIELQAGIETPDSLDWLRTRVLMWMDEKRHGIFQGVRAVWMGKRQVLRLISEFPSRRVTSWGKILQAMIATVRVPSGF